MAYSDEVLTDTPLAYYRLGEASGTTMTDSSGNGRNGTYVNTPTLGAAGLLAGDADTCVDFDAPSNELADVPYGAWLNTTSFTIEAWVRPDTTGVNRIIASRRHSDGVLSRQAWDLRIDSTNKLSLLMIWGSSYALYPGTATLAAGTTHHVVATYDGANIRLYINGALDKTTAHGSGYNHSSSNLQIAAIRYTSGTIEGERFDGRIDEVAYYGTALSETRIAAHYAAGTTTPAIAGSLAATLPALGASLAGTSTPPPVTGTLAATLPSLDVDAVGGSSAAEISGTLGSTLPVLTVSLTGTAHPIGTLAAALPALVANLAGITAAPGEITGALAAQLPSVSAAFTGTVVFTDSDLTYASDGYGYDGHARVIYDQPVAPEPAGLQRVKVRRVHQSLPAPTLVDGRPT